MQKFQAVSTRVTTLVSGGDGGLRQHGEVGEIRTCYRPSTDRTL